jgi:transposase-like protein
MTLPRAQTLIDAARELLSTTPVDEQRLYEAMIALIEQHGYTKAALVRRLGIGKQQLFRILASRRSELVRYLAMCGGQASVVEALRGMPTELREQLQQEFARTGQPYSQATLRRLKQQWAAGEKVLVTGLQPDAPAQLPAPRSSNKRMGHATTANEDNEEAFLRGLVAAVATGEQELLRRLSQVIPDSVQTRRQPEPGDTPRAGVQQPAVRLTADQARRLIRRLGGNADVPAGYLQAELLRLIRRR